MLQLTGALLGRCSAAVVVIAIVVLVILGALPVRSAIVNDAAVANFDDAIGIGGHLRIVRDDDHGVAFGVQLAQNAHDFLSALAVQCAGRLVGENDFTAIDQCARDTHALLLPAGKLIGAVVFALAQTETLQQCGTARASLLGRVARINGGDFDIAHGVQVSQQVIALENEAEILAAQTRQFVRFHSAGFLPIDQIAAACRPIQTTEDIHQRGFARAGLADDGDHFTGSNLQIDVV